jgi:hypothetical protein
MESWPKVIVTALAAPFVFLLLSSFLIPGIIEDANRTEAVRAARVKKALDIGDHNRDFTSRLNVLKTRMHMFNELDVRGHLSSIELQNAQKTFQKEHTDDYLELDKMAWWWYWDLEREGEVSDVLSSNELNALHALLDEYAKNANASVCAISPLWKFLSSAEYSLSKDIQSRIELMEAEMNAKLQELYEYRTQIVKDMAACFAHSRCVASKPRPTPLPCPTK